MSDDKKKPFCPETNFLPPLKMVLTFLERDTKEEKPKKEDSDEKAVEKLIEKLSEEEK